jgi:molecular chaperone HtpG
MSAQCYMAQELSSATSLKELNAMQQGTINVQTENIFPIIKKFLYSDHEIFLRELVSNAVDAIQKVKTLSALGELKVDPEKGLVEIILNKEKGTLTIRDNGIGMTAEEVERYINQIAFSGAEEFLKKYEGVSEKHSIIGHFGLGFYSAFMVSSQVEIITRSQKPNSTAVHWTCDGSPEYTMQETQKKTKGTDIILHIADDAQEFLEAARISGILNKYCKFLPVPVKFGTKDEWIDSETEKDEEGNPKSEKIQVDNIVNNPEPAWTKKPADLTDEDYKSFYKELYPAVFEDPLFHIHLNVDFPFNLTGILYFPRLKDKLELNKNKISLYSNQVFITDSVENIVPDFLTLLHGVLDSPDIPLNVSRSYLQEDANVKKISSHITKKVADKLMSMFKENREDFESKWEDIKIFIEYGMLTDEKFLEKALKFALYKEVDGQYSTLEDFIESVKDLQKDKSGNTIILYTSDAEAEHSYIENAKNRGYKVLVMAGPLVSHITSLLESKHEKVQFTRVDADTIDKLIKKDEELPLKLDEKQQEKLRNTLESVVDKAKYQVSFESLSESDSPMIITQNEFMRRMKEQQLTGGGSFNMFGALPESYNLVVNGNHPLIASLADEENEEKRKSILSQTADLAMLSKGLLKGEALTRFIRRSVEFIN